MIHFTEKTTRHIRRFLHPIQYCIGKRRENKKIVRNETNIIQHEEGTEREKKDRLGERRAVREKKCGKGRE